MGTEAGFLKTPMMNNRQVGASVAQPATRTLAAESYLHDVETVWDAEPLVTIADWYQPAAGGHVEVESRHTLGIEVIMPGSPEGLDDRSPRQWHSLHTPAGASVDHDVGPCTP